jgi:hypothetical protein
MRYTYIAFLVNTSKLLERNTMENLKSTSIETDGGTIKETDAMGREKFWEDLGRPNDGK